MKNIFKKTIMAYFSESWHTFPWAYLFTVLNELVNYILFWYRGVYSQFLLFIIMYLIIKLFFIHSQNNLGYTLQLTQPLDIWIWLVEEQCTCHSICL